MKFNEGQASIILHASCAVLSAWRIMMVGPKWEVVEGVVLYDDADLEDWIVSRKNQEITLYFDRMESLGEARGMKS